ncbi:P-type ATPase (P-ATPase) [Phytophthora cinnamomi]|uniref:P-type ATPase (P-ATPase) n=1 Tax=Phytophthora cinnamomi TaxID=4785 RepID=UPI00355A1414|nr:P-type ATPase (P-ATPase) [Phytophthora cinnamomi]
MPDKLVAVAVVLALAAIVTTVDGAANPMDYPACPQRHQPEYFCCSTSTSTREVFTKFRRPTGGSYEEDYQAGWAQARQVNFPYVRYTPDTPSYLYDDPASICRMQTVVIDSETGELQQTLQCGGDNVSLVEDSQDSSVFWTSPSNPRNNNASFPVGAQCVSLMLADGSVDEDSKSACVNDRLLGGFQFTSFVEAPLVVVYLVYLTCFALLVWWNFHRHVIFRNSCLMDEDEKKTLASSGVADLKGIITRPRYELIHDAISVLLHVLLIIIICDYYGSFTPALFDPLSASATVFFLVWLFAALWMIGIVAYQRDLPNFFKVPSALHSCEFVHILKSDDTEIMLTDRTGVSALVAKVENWFSSSVKLRGYQETVRVETVGGKRIVDFQHLRYVYSDDARRFVPSEISMGRTYADIGAAGASGLSTVEAEKRLQTIGLNVVDVAMPSLLSSVLYEFLTLFYIYQIIGSGHRNH